MRGFRHNPSGTYKPLDLREFVSALNTDADAALAQLKETAASNRKTERSRALVHGVSVALALLVFITFVMSAISGFDSSALDRDFLKRLAAVLLIGFVLLVFWFRWLHLTLYENSLETASSWSKPLAESKSCMPYQSLVRSYPDLPLLPQAEVPRALYVADYLLAYELVNEANAGREAQNQREACTNLHSQAFAGNKQE